MSSWVKHCAALISNSVSRLSLENHGKASLDGRDIDWRPGTQAMTCAHGKWRSSMEKEMGDGLMMNYRMGRKKLSISGHLTGHWIYHYFARENERKGQNTEGALMPEIPPEAFTAVEGANNISPSIVKPELASRKIPICGADTKPGG